MKKNYDIRVEALSFILCIFYFDKVLTPKVTSFKGLHLGIPTAQSGMFKLLKQFKIILIVALLLLSYVIFS